LGLPRLACSRPIAASSTAIKECKSRAMRRVTCRAPRRALWCGAHGPLWACRIEWWMSRLTNPQQNCGFRHNDAHAEGTARRSRRAASGHLRRGGCKRPVKTPVPGATERPSAASGGVRSLRSRGGGRRKGVNVNEWCAGAVRSAGDMSAKRRGDVRREPGIPAPNSSAKQPLEHHEELRGCIRCACPEIRLTAGSWGYVSARFR